MGRGLDPAPRLLEQAFPPPTCWPRATQNVADNDQRHACMSRDGVEVAPTQNRSGNVGNGAGADVGFSTRVEAETAPPPPATAVGLGVAGRAVRSSGVCGTSVCISPLF